MVKKYLPNCVVIGMLILAFLIRVHVFFRGKVDPTALDLYNILQIGVTFLLGVILIIRKDFPYVFKIIIKSPLGWLVLLYVFGVLSGLWSVIPLFSTYFGLEGMIYIFAFALILFQQPDNIGLERLAVKLSYLFIALYIIGLIRMMGVSLKLSHWHSNAYPAVASMLFGYCLGEYFNRYRNKSTEEKKLLKHGIWIGLFFVVIGTSSGSNIASAAAILAVILISGRRAIKIIAFLSIIILLFTWSTLSEEIFKIVFPYKSINAIDTFGGRLGIWESYTDMIRKKPFAGYGFASLSRVAKFYNVHTHNSLIEIVGGVGFIGLVLFVIYLARVYYKFLTNLRSPYIIGAIAAITAGLVNSNSISIIGAPSGSMFFAFIVWNLLGWYYLLDFNFTHLPNNEINLGNT